MKYIIISPVRDEEKYIQKTIDSVVSQTIIPLRWVIVNDGSIDNTGSIIDEYSRRYDWISTIHRKNRGYRQPGTGVMEAFYEGYNTINENEWEFLVKLDGDLEFNKDYFEKCFNKFEVNKKLGVGGGIIFNRISNKLVEEKNPRFHVRGATKIYKRDCWDVIGPLIMAPGWDTLDEVKANMKGFETKSFEDIQIIQNRPTGTAEGNFRDSFKNGMANYISGYHPIFMLVKFLNRIFQKPYVIGAIYLLYGYLSGYIKNVDKVNDKELIKYIRNQQVNKLLLRKSIWE